MPQKTSPFIEGKYGWTLGESGWNLGMDENLLKFSYLFDRNIDGIVSSLPPAVNGQAYFNTTDNRVYFVVENVYSSTPLPKNFLLADRATGDVFLFNGVALVPQPSVTDIDTRLDSVETITSSLGTAAFEDITNLVKSSDLLNTSDPTKNAALIGWKDGTVADYLENYLPSRTHIRKFGVVGDAVTDDSDALEAAILSGVPIDFGDLAIRITRRINVLIPGKLDWKSDGAKILNYSSAETPGCIDLEVLPTYDHRVVGVLEIDGRGLSSVGFRAWNKSTLGFPAGYASIYIEDMKVTNIRRGFVTSANGDGIIIRGGFSSVYLNRPVVSNVLLAAGAGILGSVGVTGITVFGESTGFPIQTIIVDPQVDTIKSEDPAYNSDQDGVRVFGPWSTAGVKSNSVFILRGGSFRDCWGRSVKSQAETGVIDGTNFSNFSGPTSGRNSEIDFQVGGGMVRNIQAYYSGTNTVPNEVVSGQPNPTYDAFSLQVSGVQVYTTTTLPSVVSTFPRAKTQHKVVVKDIDVIGPLTRLVEFRVWSNLTSLDVTQVTVTNLLNELVRVTASGAAGSPFVGKVNIRNVTNLGTVRALVTDKVSGLAANSIVSSQDCDGFTIPTIFSESASVLGGATRFGNIIGEDASSGSLRIKSATVADGVTVAFPGHGFNAVAMAMVSFGFNNLSQALIAFSASGVVLLTPEATAITVGTTTEPATGTFRIWYASGALQVKNASGSSRQCSIQYFG